MRCADKDPEVAAKGVATGLFGPEVYRSWKSWSEDTFGNLGDVEKRTFQAELELAGTPFDEKLRVLEIGFGNGSFATWVKSQGWIYVGTEIDRELVLRARSRGFDVHDASEALSVIAAGRRFDLVVAFDVLEHFTLVEIDDFLMRMKNVLAPGGRFLARFPSGDSPFSRAIQYGDLTHRSIIGSGIITQLALKAGLHVVQIRSPAFPILGLGIKRCIRRIGVMLLRILIARIINLAFHDNRPRIIEPNMVIVLEMPH